MLRRFSTIILSLCASFAISTQLFAQDWSRNLIYNGDLAQTAVQLSEGKVVLEGWEKNSDMMVVANSSTWRLGGSFSGVKGSRANRVLVVLDGTFRYGTDATHRLTLTAGQRYTFAVKHSSFYDNTDTGIDVKISPSNGGASVLPLMVKRSLPENVKTISDANALRNDVVYFTAPVTGDYILSITTPGIVCLTDFCLSVDQRPLGDVDCDGDVDIDDLADQSKILLEMQNDWQGRADVTGDNKLSIQDISKLVSLLMSKAH